MLLVRNRSIGLERTDWRRIANCMAETAMQRVFKKLANDDGARFECCMAGS